MGSIPIRFRQGVPDFPVRSRETTCRAKLNASRRRRPSAPLPKSVARPGELQGTPPPTRVIPDKRRKPPKHKEELLEEG